MDRSAFTWSKAAQNPPARTSGLETTKPVLTFCPAELALIKNQGFEQSSEQKHSNSLAFPILESRSSRSGINSTSPSACHLRNQESELSGSATIRGLFEYFLVRVPQDSKLTLNESLLIFERGKGLLAFAV